MSAQNGKIASGIEMLLDLSDYPKSTIILFLWLIRLGDEQMNVYATEKKLMRCTGIKSRNTLYEALTTLKTKNYVVRNKKAWTITGITNQCYTCLKIMFE